MRWCTSPPPSSDGVFVGPAVVLTNDLNPRAVDVAGRPKSATDWTPVAVHVKEGASLGARSVCVAPVTIGRWAMVGAGAVVVDDVPDFALVVGRAGPPDRLGRPRRLPAAAGGDGTWHCERTGDRYVETEGVTA